MDPSISSCSAGEFVLQYRLSEICMVKERFTQPNSQLEEIICNSRKGLDS